MVLVVTPIDVTINGVLDAFLDIGTPRFEVCHYRLAHAFELRGIEGRFAQLLVDKPQHVGQVLSHGGHRAADGERTTVHVALELETSGLVDELLP